MGKNIVISKLEQKNAQIDVWMDEEKYDEIDKEIECNVKLSKCFNDPNCTNSKRTDDAWVEALNTTDDVPVELKDGTKIDKNWSKLFYAKLLRSKIQEKGTDCYFRRLDQVVAYLEKYIPDPYKNVASAKLAVLCQLELSAASLAYEIMGYAERARRLLYESNNLKADKKFRWFYELLARYNIGVSHFHISNYSKAILEFNYIIFEINKLKDKDKLNFYNARKGPSLLYLPAIIYRADIQLKQQLAYHALKTLMRCSSELKNEDHKYQRYKADLIKIQANQLMGELQEAGGLLRGLWEDLFKEKQAFPYFNKKEGMIYAKSFNADIPAGTDRQNIKGRLLTLAIDQHLNCLRRQTGILMQDDSEANNYDKAPIKWVNNHSEYMKDLGRKSIVPYFLTVEFIDSNRMGYWEQVAEYLSWLAALMEVKALKDNEKTLEKVRSLAGFCYEFTGIKKKKMLIEYLFDKSRREDKDTEWGCTWCDPKGIDLIRLQPDHYDDFTEHMLKVLEKGLLNSKGEQKEEFINRLLEVEESRTDLRIKDLELRYKSQEVMNKLPSGSSVRDELCWCDIEKEDRTKFGLLPCVSDGEANDLLPTGHYERVMKQWDDYFLHHLESPSNHERQEPGIYFLGLQRWNSSSPAKGYSVGGGYLIYRLNKNRVVDLGIAIDPGFDFIRNLFHTGFSLNDIHIVLISHAHVDHIRDFESIVTLLFELAKRGKQYKKVHVVLSLGVYMKLKSIFENHDLRLYIEPYIIDIDREIETDYFENLANHILPEKQLSFRFQVNTQGSEGILGIQPIVSDGYSNSQNDYCVRVRPTRAYHDDHSGVSDSFGFLIDMRLPDDKNNEEVVIGYTGDTKWIYPKVNDPLRRRNREIAGTVKQYVSCNALIMHLGSLIDKNKENGSYTFRDYNQCLDPSYHRCEDLVRGKQHPYLIGLLRQLNTLYHGKNCKPLVLIGEFGEELRGKIRVDLVKRLQKVYGDRILPVDVGMNVQLANTHRAMKPDNFESGMKAWCVQCNRLVAIDEADFEHYGVDEAIYCVCKMCLKGTPLDVLQNRLRHLYEVGYELHTTKRII